MRIHSAVVLLVALLAISAPAAGQVRSPAPAQAPKWSAVDSAVGKESYAEAKQKADAVLQSGTPEDRAKTALVYPRILLGLGQKDQARQCLDMLSGVPSGNKKRPSAKSRAAPASGQQAIYEAWLMALDKKPAEAEKTLEKMLEQSGNAPDETTAEAADVLAMLYMARGEHEKAKKSLDFGLKILKYRGTKGGYVLALLRGRLNSDFTAGEAKRLYNEAEKLREKGKFVEAGQLFAQVRAMYGGLPSPAHGRGAGGEGSSASQWGHASGFRIGQCFLGLNQPAKAIDWWQKFIKESPAGPWRGQAHVGLVDITLESQLNLKAATEHALAAGAVLAKGLDKDAEPSWKEAAYDIYLRQGIVSLVDGRFDAAVQGFQQAKQSAPKAAGLDRLIEAAQNRVKLVPDELTVGDDRATVALVLGNIYNILRQYDVAKGWFSLPLNGSMRSRSAGHRSFAGLGLARAIVGSGQGLVASGRQIPNSKSPNPKSDPLAQAAIAYEASLKEYPKGSWHADTLRELALLIERAANESGQSSVASGQKTANPKSPNSSPRLSGEAPGVRAAPLTDAARQQQKKTLIAARAAALPFWTELPKRYPTSRHVPQALYHAGVLYTESVTGGLSRSSSDENGTVPFSAEKALAAFEELAKKYPDSPWTGDAHVRLIDVKLEHQFDLPGARNHADAAVAWYERLAENGTVPLRGLSPFPQASSTVFPDDTLPPIRQTGYDIYVRAGLVEYLLEHPERAVGFFEKAKPLAPERNFVVVHGYIPTGIERLIEAAKSGKSLTPEIVRKGDEKGKLILMLADVYHEGEQWQRSLDLCTRVIENAATKATREQKSYAHFKRGKDYYCLDGKDSDPDAAFKDYAAAVRTASTAPWADKAMFLAANILWNHKDDPDKAVDLWRRLLRSYPNSKEADRSAYYIGVAYEWSNRPEEADRAYQELLEKRPGSRFAAETRRRLAEVQKQEQEAKTKKDRRTKANR